MPDPSLYSRHILGAPGNEILAVTDTQFKVNTQTQTQKANRCTGPSVGTSDLMGLFRLIGLSYRFKFSQVEIQEMTGIEQRGICALMSRLGG